MTITAAATALGVSRPYLTQVANGRPASKRLARKIATWSDQQVPELSILHPADYKTFPLDLK